MCFHDLCSAEQGPRTFYKQTKCSLGFSAIVWKSREYLLYNTFLNCQIEIENRQGNSIASVAAMAATIVTRARVSISYFGGCFINIQLLNVSSGTV